MAQKSQHDKIGVQTVQAMSNVGVVIRLCPGLAYVLHDLVLPLSRDVVAREDHLTFPPVRILTDLLVHKVLELFGELGHEHGAC